MAVNVDSVYQKVLAIANKEQRGYITPLEFNLLANQAQDAIFEQYFYDIKQWNDQKAGNATEYSDMLDVLAEKISPFEQYKQDNTSVANTNEITLPTDVYRLGTVFYRIATDNFIEVERVEKNDLEYMQRTALFSPPKTRPVYARLSDTKIKIFPKTNNPAYSTSNVLLNYIKKPAEVYFGYVLIPQSQGGNEYPLYDAANSVDFELHQSEENTLVYKILELAGVVLNKPGLIQIAAGEEQQITQEEKV
jgi:hypothetical protein|tara:strand:- start:1537 stop:2283 length:747 start_codon:yes stop_codon:yes gene_type:complete